jgi:hypothetical protein
MSELESRDAGFPFILTVPTKAAMLTTVGLILLGLVLLYYETYNMVPSFLLGYPGDAFFPRVVLVFTMFWAVVILIRGLFLAHEAAAVGDEEPYISVHWLEFTSILVLGLLYAQLLRHVGFEILTVVLLMILLVPRLLAGPGAQPVQAVLQGLALSVTTMLVLYLALGPFLKIALPLQFLPVFLF